MLLRQFGQQHLGILEVRRVKSLGKPVVDRGQQVAGFLFFPLLLPQPGQARGGAEFPGFSFLLASNVEGFLIGGFRLLPECLQIGKGNNQRGASRAPRAPPYIIVTGGLVWRGRGEEDNMAEDGETRVRAGIKYRESKEYSQAVQCFRQAAEQGSA